MKLTINNSPPCSSAPCETCEQDARLSRSTGDGGTMVGRSISDGMKAGIQLGLGAVDGGCPIKSGERQSCQSTTKPTQLYNTCAPPPRFIPLMRGRESRQGENIGWILNIQTLPRYPKACFLNLEPGQKVGGLIAVSPHPERERLKGRRQNSLKRSGVGVWASGRMLPCSINGFFETANLLEQNGCTTRAGKEAEALMETHAPNVEILEREKQKKEEQERNEGNMKHREGKKGEKTVIQ